jgi:hypothetical protein
VPQAGVNGNADRQHVDDQVDQRLIEVEQIVALVVVAGRPLRVRGV